MGVGGYTQGELKRGVCVFDDAGKKFLRKANLKTDKFP